LKRFLRFDLLDILMTEAGSPVKEFIEQAKDQAIAGLGNDWELKEPIKLVIAEQISSKFIKGFGK